MQTKLKAKTQPPMPESRARRLGFPMQDDPVNPPTRKDGTILFVDLRDTELREAIGHAARAHDMSVSQFVRIVLYLVCERGYGSQLPIKNPLG